MIIGVIMKKIGGESEWLFFLEIRSAKGGEAESKVVGPNQFGRSLLHVLWMPYLYHVHTIWALNLTLHITLPH